MKRIMKVLLASLFVMSMVFCMNVVTTEAAPPAKVTGVKQIGADTNRVKLTWNASLDSKIGYVVELSTDKVTWVEASSSSSIEQTVSKLNPGATYFARVKAVANYYSSSNNKEDGVYSDPIEVVTVPSITTEKIVQTSATSSSVTVCWNAVPGATAYDVAYRSSSLSSEAIPVGPTTATSMTINGLPADLTYTVYVYPKKTAVSTQFTAQSSQYMYATSVRTAPGKVASAITDRDPRKKEYGKKNADYNTLAVSMGRTLYGDGYDVYLFNDKGKKIKTINTTRYNRDVRFKGVKTTATVSVQVVPYILINGVKNYGVPSDKIFSAGTPTMNNVKKSGSGVKISWKKLPGAKKYVVYMSTDNKTYKKVKTVKSKTTSVVLTKFKGKKFKKYQDYYYYVQAVGTFGGKKNAKSDVYYANKFWFSTKYVNN